MITALLAEICLRDHGMNTTGSRSSKSIG